MNYVLYVAAPMTVKWADLFLSVLVVTGASNDVSDKNVHSQTRACLHPDVAHTLTYKDTLSLKGVKFEMR